MGRASGQVKPARTVALSPWRCKYSGRDVSEVLPGRSSIKDETAGGSALPTRGRGEDAIVRFSFLSGLLAGGTLQGGRPGLLTSDKKVNYR